MNSLLCRGRIAADLIPCWLIGPAYVEEQMNKLGRGRLVADVRPWRFIDTQYQFSWSGYTVLFHSSPLPPLSCPRLIRRKRGRKEKGGATIYANDTSSNVHEFYERRRIEKLHHLLHFAGFERKIVVSRIAKYLKWLNSCG